MIVKASKKNLNGLPLPGMGRSVELMGLTQEEHARIRTAFAASDLMLQWIEEGDQAPLPIRQVWSDPHDVSRMTLFFR